MAINGSQLKVHTIVAGPENIDAETMKFIQDKMVHAMHTVAVLDKDSVGHILKIVRTVDYEDAHASTVISPPAK